VALDPAVLHLDGAAQGGLDPLAKPSRNGRYLRNRDVETMSRIDVKGTLRIAAVDVAVGRKVGLEESPREGPESAPNRLHLPISEAS
jgi:hypothetical protein